MVQEDYVTRMIKDMVRMIAKVLLRKDTISYEFPEEETTYSEEDREYQAILSLLHEGDINEAENMLYDNFRTGDETYILMGLDFYQRLNELSGEYLEAHDYSREEVDEGLRMFSQKQGLTM